MKLLSLIVIISMFASISNATQMCAEIPDTLTYESMVTNFDGSLTILVPRLSVEGKPMRIAYDRSMAVFPPGALGVCHLLGKDYVAATYKTDLNNSQDPVIFISHDATLLGVPNKRWTDSLYKVICK